MMQAQAKINLNIGIVYSPRPEVMKNGTLLRFFWSHGNVRLVLPFQEDRSIDVLILPDEAGVSCYNPGFQESRNSLGPDACATTALFVKETLGYYIGKGTTIIGIGDGGATLYGMLGGQIAFVHNQVVMIPTAALADRMEWDLEAAAMFVDNFCIDETYFGVRTITDCLVQIVETNKKLKEDMKNIKDRENLSTPRLPKPPSLKK